MTWSTVCFGAVGGGTLGSYIDGSDVHHERDSVTQKVVQGLIKSLIDMSSTNTT